jgi:hypothetical protein
MDRKEIARRYRETSRPAGAYRVTHQPSGRTLIGASPDVPARLNRIRAQLDMNSHPNNALQADWVADGEGAFGFEIVDLLDTSDNPDEDIRDDLDTLHQLWREKLQIGSAY